MNAPTMKSSTGTAVPLQSVAIQAELSDLLEEVTLAQTYRNRENVNIEAVYTFPLPRAAVLLALEVALGQKTLAGVVVGSAQAEHDYEEAITDGDSAVMLEEVEPGLYSLSVGNLLAGETATVKVRYAKLHRWNGEILRFVLPTVVAPRYGAPEAQRVQPHQVPGVDPFAANAYALSVTLRGALRDAELESPTHAVAVAKGEAATEVTLAKGSAWLDRDFVLNVRAPHAARAFAAVDRDGARYIAAASFVPAIAVEPGAGARSVKIVVDCSGSMAGDSIAQAREAVRRILASLRPQDAFNITVFGSAHRSLFPACVPAEAGRLEAARAWLAHIDADMGGTEIAAALAHAFALAAPGFESHDVLLVTDGEVWGAEAIIAHARASGHRIFPVGVGAAPAESLVHGIAEATGGACERVTPREDMASRIHRHFERILQPRARSARVLWPAEARATSPAQLPSVYHGDTVTVFAAFDAAPQGEAKLVLELADGRAVEQRVALPGAAVAAGEERTTLARLAAASRLAALSVKEDAASVAAATQLAVDYQLMSRHTNLIAVHARAEAEKAGHLPALRRVPQMLVAGWGGSATVRPMAPPPAAGARSTSLGRPLHPSMLLEAAPLYPARKRRVLTVPVDLTIEAGRWTAADLEALDLVDLERLGLPAAAVAALRTLLANGAAADECTLVAALLAALLALPAKLPFPRETRRLLRKHAKDCGVPKPLGDALAAALARSTPEAWHFDATALDGLAAAGRGNAVMR